MKKILLGIILLCVGMLTGCVQLVDMSEEESDIIAEYMAGTYLQQTNYKENLIYPNEEAADNQTTKEVNSTDNSQKNATSNVDKSLINPEDKTLEVNVIDAGLDNTTDSKANPNTTSSKNDSNSTKNETDTKELSINDIINYKNFSIQYSNYKVSDSFQSKINGTYFNLEPTTGSKLLVVHFKIKNESDKSGKFNLNGKEIKYKLTDSTTEYLPMLTLLNEDLQYIDVTIKPGKTYNAVIVYEVPKNIDKSKISLSVSKNSKSSNITMN